MFESLEPRRLMVLPISGTVIDLDDTPDVAFVTAGNDVIEIILSGGNIQVRNGAGTVLDQISAAGKTGISVNGQGGDDFIRLGRADGTLMPAIPVTIHGGAGNDTVIGGNSADQIFGDEGNDRLDGRAAGDVMNGGVGFDTADYGYRVRSTNLSLANSASANDGTTLGNNATPDQYNDNGSDNLVDIEAAIGSSNADYMVGNTAANWLDGGGGNDTMYGGDGIDTITGGVNTDTGYGDGGDDYFFFQDATADQFLGGTGTTSAQYDAALDTPAPVPALPAAFTASLLSSVAEDSGPLTIDDAFSGGKVVTSLNGTLAQINDVAVQWDDIGDEQFEEKVIVVGTMLSTSSESYDFLIARYNSDGTLDDTFGDEGIVLVDFGMSEFFSTDVATSLAIGEDGKIIVVGGAERDYGDTVVASEYAIARLLEDGALDEDFGFGGVVVGAPDDVFSYDVANRVVIQYVEVDEAIFEERYIVTGVLGSEILTDATSSVDWGTLRLKNNGDYDDSFGGGLIRTDFSDIEFASDDYATGLAIDPETGNVWVSGYMDLFGSQFVVKGFTADGEEIDGAVGFQDFNGLEAEAYDAVISGSELVVVGQVFVGEAPSGAGIATFDISSEPGSPLNWTYFTTETEAQVFRAVAVDNDGMGVAAGNWGDDFYIQRFDISDLSADDAPVLIDFGPQLDKSSSVDTAYGIAVQSDGKVVVAGLADDPYAAIVRLSSESEEPPFVDVVLSPEDVQNFVFTYIDEFGEPQPIPDYLVERIRAVQPDGTVELNGTPFADNICVTEEDGILTFNINGELLQVPASQVTKIIINGLDGNDYICIDCDITIPVVLNGGKGNDTLLAGGGADVVRGGDGNDSIEGCDGDDLLYGEAGKDTVRGENGNDVIFGGDGNDSLYGDAGRDIITGGLANDRLNGGSGDDILNGGITNYDNNPVAFAALLLEWTRTDANYATRVSHVVNGGGLNGAFKLNWTTVHSSGFAPDTLTGGADSDLFFLALFGDVATDRLNTETRVFVL